MREGTMTPGTVGVEALLRPFAEAPCPFCDGVGCVKCGPQCRDERFDGLRGEHDFGLLDRLLCSRCGADPDDPSPYCLDTRLGALARVAAACGWTPPLGSAGSHITGQSNWLANLNQSHGMFGTYGSYGDNPEDALARAIAAAMPL